MPQVLIVIGDATECPFAKAAVAVSACDDNINVMLLRDGIKGASVVTRCGGRQRMRNNSVRLKPVDDIIKVAFGAWQVFVIRYLNHRHVTRLFE